MAYRTHNCNELTFDNLNERVQLAGWVDTIRDHGGVAFIDLRDEYGVTQVVVNDGDLINHLKKESVISVTGTVVKRDEETINTKIATGELEVKVDELTVLNPCTENLPFEISESKETREDVRLTYRFLDLRNKKVHDNILFRSEVISYLRQKMTALGFTEITTPILTCSSPEGARDYIIPSRKHEGKFYALPQAPQQFKQLLMTSGFDKYFQIAPCFRDEDARADRSPGEFYQLIKTDLNFATSQIFRCLKRTMTENLFSHTTHSQCRRAKWMLFLTRIRSKSRHINMILSATALNFHRAQFVTTDPMLWLKRLRWQATARTPLRKNSALFTTLSTTAHRRTQVWHPALTV